MDIFFLQTPFQKWGWCYDLRLHFHFPLVGVYWLLALGSSCLYERGSTGLPDSHYSQNLYTFQLFSILKFYLPTCFVSHFFVSENWRVFVCCIFRRSWILYSHSVACRGQVMPTSHYSNHAFIAICPRCLQRSRVVYSLLNALHADDATFQTNQSDSLETCHLFSNLTGQCWLW